MFADLYDFLQWHCWLKWRYRWKHRHDTLEEGRRELYRQWENVLEEFKDDPAGRELHDAIEGMEEIKKAFGDR